MKKRSILIALTLSASTAFAASTIGGDPAALKIKVYGVYASTSPQCTNPIPVFVNATGNYLDFLAGPDLGGGDLPDGTYECVIIKMSDVIKHTPKVTDSSWWRARSTAAKSAGPGGMAV